MEKLSEKQLIFKNRNPRWGELAATTSLQYAFSAAIMLVSEKQPEPWQLVMVHKEGRGEMIEEQGYLTNGDIQFAIGTLKIGSYTNRKGKEMKVMGGPTFAGYEIRIDDGVVGIVDLLDNQVWMVNDLDPAYKMILAAASSSLLLKRKKRPEHELTDTLDIQVVIDGCIANNRKAQEYLYRQYYSYAIVIAQRYSGMMQTLLIL